MYSALLIFLTFIIYSTLGYIAEIIFCSIVSKKFVWNRGFLIGPYLPIYGFGALIIIYSLGRYSDDLLVLFVMSMVYCTALEYFTSLILEKIFHLRWWDYSEKRFNLEGRVCLTNAVLFGVGGVIIMKLHPLIDRLLFSCSPFILLIIATIILFIFLTDLVLSFRIIVGIKTNIKKIKNKDSTEQIKKEVMNFLKNYNMLTGRLLKSFPNLEKINGTTITKLLSSLDVVKNEIAKLQKKRRHK